MMPKKPNDQRQQVNAVIEGEDDSDNSVDPLTAAQRGAELEKELQQNIVMLHRPVNLEQKEPMIPAPIFPHTTGKYPKSAADQSAMAELFMHLASLEDLSSTTPKGFFAGIANVFRRNKKTLDNERVPPSWKPCTVVIRSERLYTPPPAVTHAESMPDRFMPTSQNADKYNMLCDTTRERSYDRWRTILAENHARILLQAARTAEKYDATLEPQSTILRDAYSELQEAVHISNSLSDAIDCFVSTSIQCYPVLQLNTNKASLAIS